MDSKSLINNFTELLLAAGAIMALAIGGLCIGWFIISGVHDTLVRRVQLPSNVGVDSSGAIAPTLPASQPEE